ncbi:MAG: hypothetical protein HGB04_04900 [Chlorobiaceae bacterium]|nr:hypothetical protein [Chlorobiaceae bacterium]
MSALPLASVEAVQRESEKGCWYVAASGQQIVRADGEGPDVDLGGAAFFKGSSDYQGGGIWTVSAGKEFIVRNEGRSPTRLRLELQLLDGYLDRERVQFAVVKPELNDQIKVRGLYLNSLVRLLSGETSRLWLGGGLGLGQSKFPDATHATACGCLKASDSYGMVWQAMIQGERNIYCHTSLFVEGGYRHFPGSRASGVPTAGYGGPDVITVGVGFRTMF